MKKQILLASLAQSAHSDSGRHEGAGPLFQDPGARTKNERLLPTPAHPHRSWTMMHGAGGVLVIRWGKAGRGEKVLYVRCMQVCMCYDSMDQA